MAAGVPLTDQDRWPGWVRSAPGWRSASQRASRVSCRARHSNAPPGPARRRPSQEPDQPRRPVQLPDHPNRPGPSIM